jgi:outer membrane protein assembly factor BamD
MSMLALGLLSACATSGGKKDEPQEPPEEVYQRALQKIEKKKYYSARNLLQSLLPRIPPEDRELLPKVQLAIADAFFKDRGLLNYGEALNGYRNFLTYFPDHERADHARFMVGMSLFEQVLAPDRDQALTLRAIDEFRKLEAAYPDSPYVERARRKIEECYDLLAEHERLVARFYQRRKVWNAAIDRYRSILVQYPRVSNTHLVLFDLGVCLLATGKRTEAEAFFDRLAREAPDDDMVKKSRKLLERDARQRARAALKEKP